MSPPSLILLAPLTLLTAFLLHTLFKSLTSPLRPIPPAHPLSPWSSLWIASVRRRGTENATLRAAHARLGPVVRLGPSEVSVNCVKGGIREVYAGGFEKGGEGTGSGGFNWYAFFGNYGG
ncbi:hypothetical protein BS50DRAFT_681207 [Corynespora cassiicola Philippines]|uniref:Cytochrome P450 n=1 Tax=Corynespora cassiicola Philippines TaxID=1448308 RepID=A0A2T2N6C5_CORCC|nr:hypothetical protein BS50DRAFT_681207 [Corynespora cassiicola Philippines]